MTATVFISTLQHAGYEYGAAPHTSVSSNTLYFVHPSAVQPGNNLFKCRGVLGVGGGVWGGGGSHVFNVTCHWCDHKQHFGLNQHHLDTSADGRFTRGRSCHRF